MKRIGLIFSVIALLSVLFLPTLINAQTIPIGATPPECAKLRRDATDINLNCVKDAWVGHDENFDKDVKCDGACFRLCQVGDTIGVDVPDWGACVLISNIKFAVDFVFWAFLVISLIFFVWGGFNMMSAQGEPEKFATGRRFILYGAIGVLVAIGSRLIPAVVKGFIGF